MSQKKVVKITDFYKKQSTGTAEVCEQPNHPEIEENELAVEVEVEEREREREVEEQHNSSTQSTEFLDILDGDRENSESSDAQPGPSKNPSQSRNSLAPPSKKRKVAVSVAARPSTSSKKKTSTKPIPDSEKKASKFEPYPLAKSVIARMKKNYNKTHTWMEVEPKGFWCSTCKKHSTKQGPFATEPSPIKIGGKGSVKSKLDQHEISGMHKGSIIKENGLEISNKFGDLIEINAMNYSRKEKERRIKNSRYVATVLQNYYFLFKNRLPHTTNCEGIINLTERVAEMWGSAQFREIRENLPKNVTYLSKFGIADILLCVGEWLLQRDLSLLKDSPVFSILADETSDITTHEQLTLVVRFLKHNEPVEVLLAVLQLSGCDAATITQTIREFLQRKEIDTTKCIAQGYDGASVMSGSKTGVQKRFRDTVNPDAEFFHCRGHRFALCNKYAADNINSSFLIRFFETVLKLWKVFFYSTKRTKALEDAIGGSGTKKRVPKPSDTRWLSHSRHFSMVRETYGSILVALDQIGNRGGDFECEALFKNLSDPWFVVTLVVMNAAFDATAQFAASIQGIKVDFSQINTLLAACVRTLEGILANLGEYYKKAETLYKTSVEPNFPRKSWSLEMDLDAKREVLAALSDYLNELISTVRGQFSQNHEILRAFSIFDPYKWPDTKKHGKAALGKYGNEELEIILASYPTIFPPDRVEEIRAEWPSFKSVFEYGCQKLFKNPERSVMENYGLDEEGSDGETPEICDSEKIVHTYQVAKILLGDEAFLRMCPASMDLLRIYTCLPVTTCSNERAFSALKTVKTRLRNRLSESSLDSLLRIAMNGPRELSDSDLIELMQQFVKGNHQTGGERKLELLPSEYMPLIFPKYAEELG